MIQTHDCSLSYKHLMTQPHRITYRKDKKIDIFATT